MVRHCRWPPCAPLPPPSRCPAAWPLTRAGGPRCAAGAVLERHTCRAAATVLAPAARIRAAKQVSVCRCCCCWMWRRIASHQLGVCPIRAHSKGVPSGGPLSTDGSRRRTRQWCRPPSCRHPASITARWLGPARARLLLVGAGPGAAAQAPAAGPPGSPSLVARCSPYPARPPSYAPTVLPVLQGPASSGSAAQAARVRGDGARVLRHREQRAAGGRGGRLHQAGCSWPRRRWPGRRPPLLARHTPCLPRPLEARLRRGGSRGVAAARLARRWARCGRWSWTCRAPRPGWPLCTSR
jgi:hypothetical protein